jgi:hypothetical protein
VIAFEIPGPPTRRPDYMKRWTTEEEVFLRKHYPSKGKEWCAIELSKTVNQIRDKASRMGLKYDTGSDHAKEWQAKAAASKIGKKRPGQADVIRRGIIEKGLHRPTEERRKESSAKAKAWIKENGHPRGALGLKHSVEAKLAIGEKAKAHWDSLTDDQRAEQTMRQMKAKAAKGGLVSARPSATWKAGWREVGGQRCYFRSRWEANYARYLEWLRSQGEVSAWEHEPETFWFEKIKRGCRSYLPDFRVTEKCGNVVYHEVKGWMDDRSKTKIKRMAIYHPHITLVVIERNQYEEIRRKLGALIEGWEPA